MKSLKESTRALAVTILAGALLARLTGLMPVTGLASRAITRSRSARGTSSTTSATAPFVEPSVVRPMVAVVLSLGFPAGILCPWPGSPAKQLAALTTHCGSTSAPEQALVRSPMVILAVNE